MNFVSLWLIIFTEEDAESTEDSALIASRLEVVIEELQIYYEGFKGSQVINTKLEE